MVSRKRFVGGAGRGGGRIGKKSPSGDGSQASEEAGAGHPRGGRMDQGKGGGPGAGGVAGKERAGTEARAFGGGIAGRGHAGVEARVAGEVEGGESRTGCTTRAGGGDLGGDPHMGGEPPEELVPRADGLEPRMGGDNNVGGLPPSEMTPGTGVGLGQGISILVSTDIGVSLGRKAVGEQIDLVGREEAQDPSDLYSLQ
eukprot:Gb_17527 [translate_table: standard]